MEKKKTLPNLYLSVFLARLSLHVIYEEVQDLLRLLHFRLLVKVLLSG